VTGPGARVDPSLVPGDTFVPGPQTASNRLPGGSQVDAWWSEFDPALRLAERERASRWAQRARDMETAGDESRARFARQRAAGAIAPRRPKVQACGSKTFWAQCACGDMGIEERCGQRWLCGRCQSKRGAMFREKVIPGLKQRTEEARAAWRGVVRIVLITLTVRHSGLLDVDRARIEAGWRAMRKKLHKSIGQFHFVMAWECTPGRDGLGHVHAHVAAVLPFVDFGALRSTYVRATSGQGLRVDFSVKPKKRKGQRSAHQWTHEHAANYLAKYVSKGVQLGDFEPQLAARVVSAFAEKRMVTPSKGLYVHRAHNCKACGQPFVKVVFDMPGLPPRESPDGHPPPSQGGFLFGDVGPPGDSRAGKEWPGHWD
jgi:hypothetical protein